METRLSTSAQPGAPAASSSIVSAAGSPSDLFTTLLVAQIRNQNPLEPSDPAQFVNQLSQLSQTESLQKLVSQTSVNANMLESLQALALGAQVGSDISVRSDRVSLGEQAVQGRFVLRSPAAEAALVLVGADGREHRVALGKQAAGTVGFSIDPQRQGLTPGVYTVRVETDTKETPATEISGKLASIKLAPTGGVTLDVTSVGEVPSTAIAQLSGKSTI